MTENEAKDLVYDLNMNLAENGEEEYCKALDMAIKALEKQIPYKPTLENLTIGVGKCKCGVEFLNKATTYCGNCGQKLDFKEV